MRIGELAEQAAVSRDSLRFYERLGLIRSRRGANGYRDYPAETGQQLLYIKTAQRLGFSLSEIAQHLAGVANSAAPDAAVAELLRDRLGHIERQIAELQTLRDDIHQRLGSGCPLRVLPI